jgi:methylglutaconyl-CoA hydratase
MGKVRAARKSMTSTQKRAASSAAAPPAYRTIEVGARNAIAIVTLNRPEVHNAFNETLIGELTSALRTLAADESVRAVVLIGAGESFCAGADLNWMRKMATFSKAENLADAKALAAMLATLNEMPQPTIARVHGSAFGGGVGLVACCDIAIGTPDATFALSETKLGLVPGAISPYVIEAIGARAARRYFLTAERFTAAEAFRLGLLHDLAQLNELDTRINELLGFLVTAGPRAQSEAKQLIRSVAHRPIDTAVISQTARRIARVRATPEAKEGVAAFLGKRRASWVPRGE